MINVYFSYDYELMWGVWPFKTGGYITKNIRHASDALANILALHQMSEIPANVGIVGMMLDNSDPIDLREFQSFSLAQSQRLEKQLQRYGAEKNLWKISAWLRHSLQTNPWVTVGSHTYGHIFANDATEAEMQKDFKNQNVVFQSAFQKVPGFLIMPKNQVSHDILDLAEKYGMQTVRINPDCWLYQPQNKGIIVRALRFLDAYLPILELIPTQRPRCSSLKLVEGRFFLRPNHRFTFFDHLHFCRLKLGYYYCRISNKDFHLWTHPHNLAGDITKSRKNLKRIFDWLRLKERQGELRFCRMDQAGTAAARTDLRGVKQAI